MEKVLKTALTQHNPAHTRSSKEERLPPPRIRPFFLEEISAIREIARVRQEEHRRQIAKAEKGRIETRGRSIDYEAEIRRWYDEQPPALRERRFCIDELVARFPGKYRMRPAQRVIAAALRQLGWTEHRDWTKAGRNRRYWMPPT